MSLILDVCGPSTDEAVDQAFNEGTTIPAGISNFDLSGILVFVQDGSVEYCWIIEGVGTLGMGSMVFGIPTVVMPLL